METDAIDDAKAGSRSEPRTSLFVMASMTAPSVSGPVKVRNLSTFGGLIEGAKLPAVGEVLQLRRGPLSVSGRVVWSSGAKAGLRLDAPIVVSDWLPCGLSGQAIVDDTFQRIKVGRADAQTPQRSCSSQMLPLGQDQLNESANALDALADALADHPDIIARFASQLQILDTAAQIMRKVSASFPHAG